MPGSIGGTVFAIAWAALVAPAAGHLSAAGRSGTLRRIAPLIVWFVALGAFAWLQGAPVQGWAAAALAGLFLLGSATGRAFQQPWLGASLWMIVSCALAGAATGFGQLAKPWPPAQAALLLDLSPLSLVLECAGVDWMRHPALYDPAGTLDIGPELRQAWRGTVAGPATFVVGCIALAASSALCLRNAVPPRAAHREND